MTESLGVHGKESPFFTDLRRKHWDIKAKIKYGYEWVFSNKIRIQAHCFQHLCIVFRWPITIKISSYYLQWHPGQTIKSNSCINLCKDAFCLCVSSLYRIRSHQQIWFEARRLRKEMEVHQSLAINLYFASLDPLLICLDCFRKEMCFHCRWECAVDKMSRSVTDGQLL